MRPTLCHLRGHTIHSYPAMLYVGLVLGVFAGKSVPLYNLSFQAPTVEFQEGEIVLTIKGHAEGSHWYSPPAFDFSASQAFTLNLISTT